VPKAAVATAVNVPLEVWDVDLASPGNGEIRVKLTASGVCGSDRSISTGSMPGAFPMVLGHEGAGVIEEVGPDVADLGVGDHVVISWVPRCGTCRACKRGQPFLCSVGTRAMANAPTPFARSGEQIGRLGCCGTFAEATVIPAIAAVKIAKDIPLKSASLMGCCVLTGVGAAMNTANVQNDDVVVVIGCGGIGLNAIQGARLAGAAEVVAVDVVPDKLELAGTFGATSLVDSSKSDALAEVRRLTDKRGADVAIEAVGRKPTIDQAMAMVRRGGQVVLVGAPPPDVKIEETVYAGMIWSAKTVKGCMYGSTDVQRDIPMLLEHYRSGALKLDELISRSIPLSEVNTAFAALAGGEVARSVIEFDGSP
jgi:Zn-dependent alcohol dehydrogenase